MTEEKKSAKKAVKENIDGPIQESTDVKTETSSKEKVEPSSTKSDKTEPKKIAKAGKRSEKAIKEVEEKEAKEARKAEAKSEDAAKPAAKQAPKTRTVLERKSKKFQEAAKLVDATKEYELTDALGLAIKSSPVKFDATIEMHIRLNVDPRQADQNIRGNLVLPSGTGRTVKIAVFAEADDAAKAKKAGADIAGIEEVTSTLDKGNIEFDVLIAVPTQMAKLGKYARLLGPRGLMPNPKSGTVTPNVVKAVEEAKAGRVEFRVDSTGIIHLGIGKASFGDKKLEANASAVLASIKSAKPASVKGTYFKTMYVSSTMGPSIKVVNP